MPGARAAGGVVGGYRPDQEAGRVDERRAARGLGRSVIHTRSLRADQFHVTPGGDSGIRPPWAFASLPPLRSTSWLRRRSQPGSAAQKTSGNSLRCSACTLLMTSSPRCARSSRRGATSSAQVSPRGHPRRSGRMSAAAELALEPKQPVWLLFAPWTLQVPTYIAMSWKVARIAGYRAYQQLGTLVGAASGHCPARG
jgi:hypothetical protein